MTSERREIPHMFSTGKRQESATVNNLADVSALIEPYRRELLLHCYRLLGSLHDAEDLVQETMLRAWQRFDTFRGAASLRTWLYTIATHACLDALKKRAPRTLPIASYPMSDPSGPIAPPLAEALWLEPLPDAWLTPLADSPEARYTMRESVSLAFLTVLQSLPPRQRAILLLSDVLDWRASEIARLLEISLSAVNSALHRARVTLEKKYHTEARDTVQIDYADVATRTLLDRYVRAWETDDIAGLVALLKEDALLNMPPYPLWYQGRDAIGGILARTAFRDKTSGHWRLYPVQANGQPAFVLSHARSPEGPSEAFGVQIVCLDHATVERQIAEVTIFHTPALVTFFGFPLQMP